MAGGDSIAGWPAIEFMLVRASNVCVPVTAGACAAFYAVKAGLDRLQKQEEAGRQLRATTALLELVRRSAVHKSILDHKPTQFSLGLAQLVSSRQQTLLRYLTESVEWTSESRAIIFVERRRTAYLVADLIRLTPSLRAKGFVAAPLVGHGGKTGAAAHDDDGAEERGMGSKQQQAVVKSFRNGKVNLLVSTSVGEEGLDVQACNLVVRFGRTTTVTALVQSRGRARHKTSKFVVLVSGDKDLKTLQLLYLKEQNMKRVVQEMMKQCVVLALRRPSVRLSVGCAWLIVSASVAAPRYTGVSTLREKLHSLGEAGARRFFERDAVKLLHDYCLEEAGATPTYTPRPAPRKGPSGRFVSEVQLPPQLFERVDVPAACNIQSAVRGEDRPTKKKANLAAAYAVLVALHNHGVTARLESSTYLRIFGRLVSADGVDVDEDAQVEAAAPQQPSSAGADQEFHCVLCGITCNSAATLRSHQQGKRHRKRQQQEQRQREEEARQEQQPDGESKTGLGTWHNDSTVVDPYSQNCEDTELQQAIRLSLLPSRCAQVAPAPAVVVAAQHGQALQPALMVLNHLKQTKQLMWTMREAAPTGQDHEPCFEFAVEVGEKVMGRGKASSKKAAKRRAAEAVCTALGVPFAQRGA